MTIHHDQAAAIWLADRLNSEARELDGPQAWTYQLAELAPTRWVISITDEHGERIGTL